MSVIGSFWIDLRSVCSLNTSVPPYHMLKCCFRYTFVTLSSHTESYYLRVSNSHETQLSLKQSRLESNIKVTVIRISCLGNIQYMVNQWCTESTSCLFFFDKDNYFISVWVQHTVTSSLQHFWPHLYHWLTSCYQRLDSLSDLTSIFFY